MKTRRPFTAALALATLLLFGPVHAPAAETRFIDYAVEWFDPTGRLIATGWLHTAVVPEAPAGHRIVGYYRPDRREDGAPRLSPQESRVRGTLSAGRLELGISIDLFDAVRIEGRVIGADARIMQGQWRYPDNRGYRYGAWRAYAIGKPPSSRPRR